MTDCIIIGAGVVGSLIARELSAYKLNVIVIEKENDVGNVTSMANSAIVHSGYDPVPGTNKAKFNVLGNAMYDKLCDELDVEFERIGSLTVATCEEHLKTLEDLAKRSKENGVPVKILNKDETFKLEPNLSKNVLGSLFAPTAGIVNPFTLTCHAAENAASNGVKFNLDEEVISISKQDNTFIVRTNKSSYETQLVINCAGFYSDKIHSMIEDIDYKITARKGEYFVLDHFNPNYIKHTIFPLPTEKGKGVLISPTTSGDYIVGPSAEPVEDRDDLSCDKPTLDNIKEQVSLMVENIPYNQVIRCFAGNRPTPSNHDFNIGYAKSSNHFINCSGIESPGLVSSPAIAKYVVNELVSKVIKLEKNPNFNPCVKKRIRISKLSPKEAEKYIKERPEYGTIVCNCEKVSLGEILDELNSPLPPTTIKGIKKRTRAGFGHCQGGFCQPIVLFNIAKKYGIDPTDVKYDKDGSIIIPYKLGGND